MSSCGRITDPKFRVIWRNLGPAASDCGEDKSRTNRIGYDQVGLNEVKLQDLMR